MALLLYAGFFRFSELASLRVKVSQFVTHTLLFRSHKVKYQYRKGQHGSVQKVGNIMD